MAFLQSILSQLLDNNVGDARLFNHLAACHEAFRTNRSTRHLKEELWTAVKIGLTTTSQRGVNVAIIVDGLDEATTGSAKLYKKICDLVCDLPLTHVITLSRPAPYIKRTDTCTCMEITGDDLRDDIEMYLKSSLTKGKTWNSIRADKQKDLLDLLASQTKEPFLRSHIAS